MSDKHKGDAEAAASDSSDDEVDSPDQSSGSDDSGLSSAESDSAGDSKSDLLDLEEEEEGLQQAELDMNAPREKRRRATNRTNHDDEHLSLP